MSSFRYAFIFMSYSVTTNNEFYLFVAIELSRVIFMSSIKCLEPMPEVQDKNTNVARSNYLNSIAKSVLRWLAVAARVHH